MTQRKQYPLMTHPHEQWPYSPQSEPESGMCTNSPSHCPLCKKKTHILMIFKLFVTTYHFGFWKEKALPRHFFYKGRIKFFSHFGFWNKNGTSSCFLL